MNFSFGEDVLTPNGPGTVWGKTPEGLLVVRHSAKEMTNRESQDEIKPWSKSPGIRYETWVYPAHLCSSMRIAASYSSVSVSRERRGLSREILWIE